MRSQAQLAKRLRSSQSRDGFGQDDEAYGRLLFIKLRTCNFTSSGALPW